MKNITQIPVWDIAVRLFHWSLVALFIVGYITGEVETALHSNLGYAILALISFRVIWGFIGTPYARFSQFIYSPTTTIAYLRSLMQSKPKHYTGHNPAGGWMVLMLLFMLFTISFTGIKLQQIEDQEHANKTVNSAFFIQSAVADDDEHDEHDEYKEHHGYENPDEEFWEEIHESAVNLMRLFILLHIIGVVVSGRLHGENLVKAMITGKKDNIE